MIFLKIANAKRKQNLAVCTDFPVINGNVECDEKICLFRFSVIEKVERGKTAHHLKFQSRQKLTFLAVQIILSMITFRFSSKMQTLTKIENLNRQIFSSL